MGNRHLFLSCLLLALGLGVTLAACGGGEAGGEEEAVTHLLEKALSADPADCTRAVTDDYLKQRTGKTGAAAVKACETEAEVLGWGIGAESVEASNVRVDGPRATGDVAFKAGAYDGQALGFSMVREAERWKIDQITGFTNFDRDAAAKAMEGLFRESSPGVLTRVQLDCLVDGIHNAPARPLEELLLRESPPLLTTLEQRCTDLAAEADG